MGGSVMMRYVCSILFLWVSVCEGQVQKANLADRPSNADVVTFYALGDWGAGFVAQEPVALALERNVARVSGNRAVAPFVIELGDNVYESGLPYHQSSDALIYAWHDPEIFNLLENTFGQVYSHVLYNGQHVVFHVISGNHDYDGLSTRKDKKHGDVLLQESKAEHLYAGWWLYYPIDHAVAQVVDSNDFREYVYLRKYADQVGMYGLTLPQKLDLPDQNVMAVVALDTQIMLEIYEEDEDLIEPHWARLEELLAAQTQVPWKIIVGHHPISSWGIHGGAQGGLKGFVRYGIGHMQDLKDGDYKKFRKRLAAVMKKYGVQFYFSGHEHNLQFISLDQQDADLLQLDKGYFQVVSGSAGKISSVDDDHEAVFAYDRQKGFVRLDVTRDAFWIEFLSYDAETGDDVSLGVWKVEKYRDSDHVLQKNER